ncbi:peptidase inhibitor family I36 protein [Streptomyces sp. NPDC057238]|uniref:peptidase inhibitor family I36 protein n=1 Tax=Streptomyces sp. NPDC057238 TaxID=3346060 RepID=UPI003626905C
MLAGALGTLNAPAAQAHYSQCTSASGSTAATKAASSRATVTPNVGSCMNDRTTSFWNRRNRVVCLYRHENHTDDLGCYEPGASSAAMQIHNDQLTSFRFASA